MMYFNHYQHRRVIQQWRLLAHQLRQWVEKGQFQAFATEKQHALVAKLRQRYAQMLRYETAATLRKALGVGALLLGLQTMPADLAAQVNFGPVQANPFGLLGTEDLRFDTFADMDGDGDLDIVSLKTLDSYDLTYAIEFRENASTNNGTSPSFLAPVNLISEILGPNGGMGGLTSPALADLDGDGDFDIIIGTYDMEGAYNISGDIFYFENIGTPSSPSFGEHVVNPFNLSSSEAGSILPKLADLDGDGDFDILSAFYSYDYGTGQETYGLSFIKNIGTATMPDFDAPVNAPFGLPSNPSSYPLIELGDIDNDGDLDLLIGGVESEYGATTASYVYFENTGSAISPAFAAGVENPFGLTPVEGIALWPMLGDLDNDGDLDVLNGLSYSYELGGPVWTYQENLLLSTSTFTPLANVNIAAFPTTTREQVTVEITTETPEDMMLNVYTLFGTLLQQHQLPKAKYTRQSIDLAPYPAGTYILQVQTDKGAWTQQVSRQ